MRNWSVVLFLTFLSLNSSAGNIFYLGEKNSGLYDGPISPIYQHDSNSGEIYLLENRTTSDFLDHFFLPGLRSYLDFLQVELVEGESCPIELLVKNNSDLRFNYRLLTLSYLYESLLDYEAQAKWERSHSCKVNWDEVLKSCKPQSEDMLKFVLQARSYLTRNFSSALDDRFMSKKQTLSQLWDKNQGLNISYERAKYNCSVSGTCHKGELLKWLIKSCEEDKETFLRICNEQDDLFGLSQIQTAFGLMIQSHLVNLYVDQETAMGCMRRFSQLNQHKENYPYNLKFLYPIVAQQLRDTFQERYIQGRLFPLGSMKEFEQKGLKEVFVSKIETASVVTTPTVEVVEIPKVTTATTVLVIVKKEVINPIPAIIIPKKVEVHKSAFLISSELLKKFNWDSVRVNMMKLRYDYVFSHQQLEILNQKMPVYTSRKILQEMKQYDLLGTQDGPVPLIFIKYLIDTDNHQALFNLISILGKKFVVINDIDKKELVSGNDLIELLNDETTNNKWQIVIYGQKEKTTPPSQLPQPLPALQKQVPLVNPQKP